MAIDVNSTASLLGAFGTLDRPRQALLDIFFPMQQVFNTEEVYFDRVARTRPLAPFVVPTVEGKPMRSRGYQTLGFRPPYLKPKHIIEPAKQIKRRAGEMLLGDLTLGERFELALLDNMQTEDDAIARREEWMATQLLTTGAMTCASPDHPPVVIDMARNAAHSVLLSGAAQWTQTGVDPLQNLEDWASTVQVNSGYAPDIVIMDPKAGRLFTRAPGVLSVMNSFRQRTGNIDLAGVVTGGAAGNEIKLLGVIAGFQVWQYQQLYTDDLGVVHKFMPDYTVIMGNVAGAGGTRCYGAIMDADSLVPASRFPKVWKQNDPSAWMCMTQSAPLPLLGYADATFSATVASS